MLFEPTAVILSAFAQVQFLSDANFPAPHSVLSGNQKRKYHKLITGFVYVLKGANKMHAHLQLGAQLVTIMNIHVSSVDSVNALFQSAAAVRLHELCAGK